MEITIENENTKLAEYNINFEQLKNYLTEELDKYQNLVVTEEFMQSAKKSRAELNAKKKELKARLTEIKKRHNEPIDKLKLKVDELLVLIDEPLLQIDEQIKKYEIKLKEQKTEMILQIFEENRCGLEIELEKIFNPKWLNSDYSKKKITEEIKMFIERVKGDLTIIETFDEEFIVPLKTLYMDCFDMSSVMQRKIQYDVEKEKREKAKLEEKARKEQEKLKEQYEQQKNEEIIEEEIKPDEPQSNLTSLEQSLNNITPMKVESTQQINPTSTNEENQRQRIEFWVEVNEQEKLLMRNFVIENKIKCGKIIR